MFYNPQTLTKDHAHFPGICSKGREGEREGGREGGMEGGKEGGREGNRERHNGGKIEMREKRRQKSVDRSTI